MARESRLTDFLDQEKTAEEDRQDQASADPERVEQETAAQQYYGEDLCNDDSNL